MHPKLKPVIYGLGVFTVYVLLTYVLRIIFKRTTSDATIFGVYSTNDLLIGLLLAVVLTFSHQRRKTIK